MDVFVVLFFFFFKQKTAYEMRISDWSSDVCSSDLAAWIPEILQDKDLLRGQAFSKVGLHSALAFPIRYGEDVTAVIECLSQKIHEPDEAKIGRASCRERVCQYV